MTAPLQIPGIVYDPDNYQQLLKQKSQQVCDLLAPYQPPKPLVVQSPHSHFRMRAEFRIWHDRHADNHRCFYAMFEPDAPKIAVEISQFPIASLCITNIMQPLLEAINNSETLYRKLFQVEFLSTSSNDLLVSLIYHRQLDDGWLAEAQQLEQQLNIAVIGRARKQKIVVSKDTVTEELTVHSRLFKYEQKENSFTQSNVSINRCMIEWVCDFLNRKPNYRQSDLLELYCGNGNFTLPMSQYFNKTLATEISKVSIKSAQTNCTLNNITNIEFVRLSGEETASALKRERDFRRLKHLNLDDYNFSCIFVDPPRAGLDQQSIDIVKQYATIIYISCNPNTLANNLEQLNKTHFIEQFAIFDQFPYTAHCECGVILLKR